MDDKIEVDAFEKLTDFQRILALSRVNGAAYSEPPEQPKISWPQSTWMRRRLAEIGHSECFTRTVPDVPRSSFQPEVNDEAGTDK